MKWDGNTKIVLKMMPCRVDREQRELEKYADRSMKKEYNHNIITISQHFLRCCWYVHSLNLIKKGSKTLLSRNKKMNDEEEKHY